MKKGICYLVGTPIGNLEDMTYRGVRILKEVDLIAAEDTRNTIKLLNYFQINNKMISYHQHNENYQSDVLIENILEGKSIAVVTDAGMPGISDPGYEIVCKCIQEEIDIVVVPGPSALLSALVLSGMSTSTFYFGGFLSINKKERKSTLVKLKFMEETIILYEAPHKILRTLNDVMGELGNRNIAVAREMTKKYEETLRGSISQVIEHFTIQEPRGEFVIVIEGMCQEQNTKEDWDNISIEEHLEYYLNHNVEKKEAIKLIAKDRNTPKKEIYEILMKK
ncbi:MAG: 16S rRNA (cytidine(1402)-2'-O)-methyltransferase [Eubacteriales bacterium]